MRWQAGFWFTAAMLLVMGCCGRIAGAADAELILRHGKIVTVDERSSIREAIAVAGGRIVAVGDNATVLKLRGPAAKTIDLAGKIVLPGLSFMAQETADHATDSWHAGDAAGRGTDRLAAGLAGRRSQGLR